MNKALKFGQLIASAFLIYVGYLVFSIPEEKALISKFVTIILGIIILALGVLSFIARMINIFKESKHS